MTRTPLIDLDTFRDLAPSNTATQLAAYFKVRREFIEEISYVHAVPVLLDENPAPSDDVAGLRMNRSDVEDLIRAGQAFSRIGATYGVSRERIRQIAADIGIRGRDVAAERTRRRNEQVAIIARSHSVAEASARYKISTHSVWKILRQVKAAPAIDPERDKRLEDALADLRCGHPFRKTCSKYGFGQRTLKAAADANGIVLSRSLAAIATLRVRIVEQKIADKASMQAIYQAVIDSEAHTISFPSFYGWMTNHGYTSRVAAYSGQS